VSDIEQIEIVIATDRIQSASVRLWTVASQLRSQTPIFSILPSAIIVATTGSILMWPREASNRTQR